MNYRAYSYFVVLSVTLMFWACTPGSLEIEYNGPNDDPPNSDTSEDAGDHPTDNQAQDAGATPDTCLGPACGTTLPTEPDVSIDDAGTHDTTDTVEDTGSTDPPPVDPCDPDPCPAIATCTDNGGQAHCQCPQGYHLEDNQCVASGPTNCAEIDCPGRCRSCEVINGLAQCVCAQGFEFNGQDCVVADDPCNPNPCDHATQVCVPSAHCQPLGACAQRCDCSNCPNCDGDNSDGKWDDLQQHCGNGTSSPATMACNNPCPNPGDGCLPYAEQFCWPMQGCFSL